ncbi:DEAD/DEAH box helicase family protein [Halotia wernerae UHCC 0503]|nr:DEAD/DEAH box helicase family protein [Halotia wernerae UHCC 0503]
MELLVQRRTTRKSLAEATIKPSIAERYYQTRAIRRVTEAFEADKDRKALIVMATGAGKTRTAIALVEMLMCCNWVKRALFLADRVALVNQAINEIDRNTYGLFDLENGVPTDLRFAWGLPTRKDK